MHLFECEATFAAEPAEVWKVWTDVERWPEWDVSKEIAQLDGPFQPVSRAGQSSAATLAAPSPSPRWMTGGAG